MESDFIVSYRELRVYQSAMENAMQVAQSSQEFPPEEKKLLTVPLIQSARLICVYVAQAWQKRRYESAFIAKLNQAESEAATAQVWIEIAVLSSYLDAETGQELQYSYNRILDDLGRLIEHSDAWVLPIDPQS